MILTYCARSVPGGYDFRPFWRFEVRWIGGCSRWRSVDGTDWDLDHHRSRLCLDPGHVNR